MSRNYAQIGTLSSRNYAPSGNSPSASRNYAMPNETMPSSNYAQQELCRMGTMHSREDMPSRNYQELCLVQLTLLGSLRVEAQVETTPPSRNYAQWNCRTMPSRSYAYRKYAQQELCQLGTMLSRNYAEYELCRVGIMPGRNYAWIGTVPSRNYDQQELCQVGIMHPISTHFCRLERYLPSPYFWP